MTTIIHPVLYTLHAKYLKNRLSYPLFVTEGVEFDIPDYHHADAPVVASIDTKWRLPLKGLDHARARASSEAYDIRSLNGSIWAPVRRYEKRALNNWQPVKAGTVLDLHSRNSFSVSPFEVTVEKAATYAVPTAAGVKSATASDGLHNTFESFKVRDVSNEDKARVTAIEEARAFTKRLAFIDGELWQQTKLVPVIRFQKLINDSVFIDVAEPTEPDASYMVRDRAFLNSGRFQLDQWDDCIEYVKTAFPNAEITTHTKSIKVIDTDAIAFDGDMNAISQLARGLELSLRRFESDTEVKQPLDSFLTSLAAVDWTTPHAHQDVAEIVSAYPEQGYADVGINKQMITNIVDRWNMRPIENTATFGR